MRIFLLAIVVALIVKTRAMHTSQASRKPIQNEDDVNEVGGAIIGASYIGEIIKAPGKQIRNADDVKEVGGAIIGKMIKGSGKPTRNADEVKEAMIGKMIKASGKPTRNADEVKEAMIGKMIKASGKPIRNADDVAEVGGAMLASYLIKEAIIGKMIKAPGKPTRNADEVKEAMIGKMIKASGKSIRNADDVKVGGGAMIGASYVFVTQVKKKITWEKARAACQQKGGDLAVLTTYQAIDAIAPFTSFKNEKYGEYWVGATNPSKKKENWKWLSGEPIPLSFEKWGQGESRRQQPNGKEDCLAYCNGSGDSSVGLCDWGCENSADGYICQIPSK